MRREYSSWLLTPLKQNSMAFSSFLIKKIDFMTCFPSECKKNIPFSDQIHQNVNFQSHDVWRRPNKYAHRNSQWSSRWARKCHQIQSSYGQIHPYTRDQFVVSFLQRNFQSLIIKMSVMSTKTRARYKTYPNQ